MKLNGLKYDPPILLCLETAGKSCSVCISSGENIIIEKEEHQAFKHNELLADFTNELLRTAELSVDQIYAVVINKGPGSYTGLRVGFAFGKALSYASGLPLIAVSGLEGMAIEAYSKRPFDLCLPMLDARRMEVYTAVYDQNLLEIEGPAPVEIQESYFKREIFKKKVVALVGEAARKTAEIQLPPNFILIDGELKASNLIRPAMKRLSDPFIDPAYIEPLYLKEVRITTSKKTLK